MILLCIIRTEFPPLDGVRKSQAANEEAVYLL